MLSVRPIMCFSYHYIITVNNYLFFKLVPTSLSTDIRVNNATNDTLSVEWSYQTVHSRPAHYFIIIATRNDTNITEATERLDVLFWTDDVFRITLIGLKEFKWYIVRVAAGNLMGLGPYSDMLVLNHTLEGGETMSEFIFAHSVSRAFHGWGTMFSGLLPSCFNSMLT